MQRDLPFRLALTIAVASLSLLAAAQSHKLSGTVKDQHGEPVIAASVTIIDAKVSTAVDALGHFTFAQLASGDHTIRILALGFAPFEEQVQLERDTELQVVMTAAPIDLKEISIS
ncbi:MAG TPA: carboxypeptidase regulatory-like domain-containing protein, partial [Flavobacteriales bacterium]|nr:carboxypeptidase regulatory-like domain-containing protein [Flavobacteriales bacterium]